MLSGKLIRLIENHEEEIAAGFVRSIRLDPELSHLGRLPEIELRERCREIIKDLGNWLLHGHEEQLAREYERVGRTRCAESVPLDECVRGLCLIKDEMIAFLDRQGIDPDYLELYAEGQLVRRAGAFFDLLIVHLVRGYEAAQHRSVHAAA